MNQKNLILLLLVLVMSFGCKGNENSQAAKDIESEKEIKIDKNTSVILTFGQSISANHNEALFEGKEGVYNFYNGQSIKAKDPLLGATGTGGSMWIPLANTMIENNVTTKIILVSIGVGGSSITQWTSDGMYNKKLLDTLENLKANKLFPNYILWHQGSADTGMSSDLYYNQFLSIVKQIREMNVTAPILVAEHSYCGHPADQQIKDAQKRLGLLHSENIFAGANTDLLGSDFRKADNCHLNKLGQEEASKLWLDALNKI